MAWKSNIIANLGGQKNFRCCGGGGQSRPNLPSINTSLVHDSEHNGKVPLCLGYVPHPMGSYKSLHAMKESGCYASDVTSFDALPYIMETDEMHVNKSAEN